MCMYPAYHVFARSPSGGFFRVGSADSFSAAKALCSAASVTSAAAKIFCHGVLLAFRDDGGDWKHPASRR